MTTRKIFLRPLAREFDRDEINNLLSSFSNACYDNLDGVRNYILIIHITSRLREVNIPMMMIRCSQSLTLFRMTTSS